MPEASSTTNTLIGAMAAYLVEATRSNCPFVGAPSEPQKGAHSPSRFIGTGGVANESRNGKFPTTGLFSKLGASQSKQTIFREQQIADHATINPP